MSDASNFQNEAEEVGYVPSCLLEKECDRCGDAIFPHRQDAKIHWDVYVATFGDPDDADGTVLGALENAPGLCDYCVHMLTKDD